MSVTIRVSDEAYTTLVEVSGIMQCKEKRKVYLYEIIDKLVELIPDEWRKLE